MVEAFKGISGANVPTCIEANRTIDRDDERRSSFGAELKLGGIGAEAGWCSLNIDHYHIVASLVQTPQDERRSDEGSVEVIRIQRLSAAKCNFV
ncbi:unnamed protein product [Phyllotreta striolata]|uniref:Uncharacterized protein n=1 Tax=Phyllotreta striolata TaxID=444603 RepID=A0A9N9TJ07_PHYSR|nr:unnamed protein product [Phyllotreta striolata]